MSELIYQTNLLTYNFVKKDKNSNMIAMKCTYTLFTKNGLLRNIGSYILSFTFIFFNISGILFYKCGFNLLEDNINEIAELKEGNINEKNNNNIRETNVKDNIDNKIIQYKNSKKKKKKRKKNKIKVSQKNSNSINNEPKSLSKLKLNLNDNIDLSNAKKMGNIKYMTWLNLIIQK